MTLKQRWLPSMTVAGSFMTPQKWRYACPTSMFGSSFPKTTQCAAAVPEVATTRTERGAHAAEVLDDCELDQNQNQDPTDQ